MADDNTLGLPELLTPAPAAPRPGSQSALYLDWLASSRGLRFADWNELWRWSVDDLDGFWATIWDFFGVESHTPYRAVLSKREMPGAEWFPGATLNLAEHMLRPRPTGGTDANALHEGGGNGHSTSNDGNEYGHNTGSNGSTISSGNSDDDIAVIGYSQTRELRQLTFGQLREQVRLARAGLKALGVQRGDRVAGYLPNIPEALVAYLASLSLGAVWTCCAPEFGTKGVVDRLGQVAPTVLFVIDGYRYGDKVVDRRDDVASIRAALPSLRHTIEVPYLFGSDSNDAFAGGKAKRDNSVNNTDTSSTSTGSASIDHATSWAELLELGRHEAGNAPLSFEAVPFDHPASILFTSGTTGLPKPIVHGHGGLLLEHLKNHALHWDLGPGDRLMWFTTTAWMMWNAMASALLLHASIVMIDGNPIHPDLDLQWRLAEQLRPTIVGVSVGFLLQSMREGKRPTASHDLSSIRQLGIVGSPLPPQAYRWLHEQFGPEVLLNVGSGGTDVCTGIVQGGPWQPVWVGEISAASLGVDACAFDPEGRPVVGELGELVIRQPMPSMPVSFWGDTEGTRYRNAYFDKYPGVWRHGDWIRFTSVGSCVITGRSDATLNRGGVRLGTSDFYGVLETLPDIVDSLVIHLDGAGSGSVGGVGDGSASGTPGGGLGELLLFVVPASGVVADDGFVSRVRSLIRTQLSPRHVPDRIVAVPALPHTRTGKRLELPIKGILQGRALTDAVDPDAVDDPNALTQFVTMKGTWL